MQVLRCFGSGRCRIVGMRKRENGQVSAVVRTSAIALPNAPAAGPLVSFARLLTSNIEAQLGRSDGVFVSIRVSYVVFQCVHYVCESQMILEESLPLSGVCY